MVTPECLPPRVHQQRITEQFTFTALDDYAVCPYMECFGEPHVYTWSLGFWTCPTVVAGGPDSQKHL